jgi:RNA polymerase sigma factor (sigma-70 family)
VSISKPDVLIRLLEAQDERDRQLAWAAFLEQYSGLLLHIARSRNREHDAVMNCYAFIIDHLRRDDSARLRRYVSDGRGKFSTWLTVVVRRMCVDYHRQRYGRLQTDNKDRHEQRRVLIDLVGNAVALELIPDPEAPDVALLNAETSALLARELEALTPADRLILRLRFEDDLSVPEIARLLGAASPFAMYRRLQHTLAMLRRSLERAGVVSSS